MRTSAQPARRQTPPASPGGNKPHVVLFAVLGMSPPVLTETVWALAQENPKIIPDRVCVITTTRGREDVRRELLSSGVWEELRKTLRAGDRLEFGDTAHHIQVVTRGAKELEDIGSREDNEALADFILEKLRAFTETPDTRVIASIAGGRKTMSALLYACMTLIGRETDRVTHVLVAPSLERQRDPRFYFPRNRRQARLVRLMDIPFVPLRNAFADLGRMPGRFHAMVRHYSRELQTAPERVSIRLDQEGVRINGRTAKLSRDAFAALRFLIRLNQPNPENRSIQDVEKEFAEFLAANPMLPKGSAKDYLRKWVSDLRRELKRDGFDWFPGKRPHPLRLPPFDCSS